MKRIALFALLLLVAALSFGEYQILYRDTFTIEYNEPVDMPELLSGESRVYRIWLWPMEQGPPAITTTTGWQFVGETTTLSQYVITPPDPRLEYAVGVQTVFIRADAVEIDGDFAVTTEVDDVDPGGFPGVPFTYAPNSTYPEIPKVYNLRDSGM